MRRFGRHGRGRGNTSVTFTKSEPYALCYYLMTMFEDVSNSKIFSSWLTATSLIIKCAKNLGKMERLEEVVETEIKNLENKKLLVPLAEETDSCFYGTNFTFKYEQDKTLERRMRNYDFDGEEACDVDICRILSVSERPIFSSIINTAIFRDNDDFSLTDKISLSSKMQKAVFDISKIQFLVDQTKLSENEARLVLLRCRFQTIPELNSLVRDLDDSDIFTSAIPNMIGVSRKEYKYMMRDDQKIKTFGFVDEDGDYDSDLDECIEAQSIEPYFADVLKPLDCAASYSLDSFAVKDELVDISLDLLKGKNPVSLLFYGKPGSGKTELAKSLCKQTDKKIFIFKNEKELNANFSVLNRLVCLLSMEREDTIIIVDEADTLLKTLEFSFFGAVPTKTKGTVNKMLEHNMDKVIYIINHREQIDESTLRRFTFSIKFESMPATMLRSIAESKISAVDVTGETKEQLLCMLDKYHLTGASVENIVKTIESIDCKDETTLLKKAQTVMQENSLLLHGKSKMRDTVKTEYDPKVLNASMDPLKIMEMVQNAVKFAEKNKGTETGIRMLFYGLSGTGKTELARYISERLGKQIILKRASDIFGMYVGQNEKNIREAFAEAENSDAILLFDEADSFFADRNKAQRSWERSTVNEFLTQMEEFSGILVCTTNLRNIMDATMQRRFHIMVEFKPMKFDGIKIMLEKYFPAYHLSNKQVEELEDTESVTPGDFGALASRVRFMNADDVDADYVLAELKKLQTEKKNEWNAESGGSERKIGFVA